MLTLSYVWLLFQPSPLVLSSVSEGQEKRASTRGRIFVNRTGTAGRQQTGTASRCGDAWSLTPVHHDHGKENIESSREGQDGRALLLLLLLFPRCKIVFSSHRFSGVKNRKNWSGVCGCSRSGVERSSGADRSGQELKQTEEESEPVFVVNSSGPLTLPGGVHVGVHAGPRWLRVRDGQMKERSGSQRRGHASQLHNAAL